MLKNLYIIIIPVAVVLFILIGTKNSLENSLNNIFQGDLKPQIEKTN